METKTAVNFSAVPKMFNYKQGLQSGTDHIRDTRKVVILPTGGSIFGPGQQSEITFFVADQGYGSYLHPESCYVTADVQTTTAVGGSTGVGSANFNSSCNDLIERVQVRGKSSRIQLCDCRQYNVYSAMRDRLKYPEAFEGKAPWSRGFVDRIEDGHDAATAAAKFSENYGLTSRGKTNVEELENGSRRYRIELGYTGFFSKSSNNDGLGIPLASSGGLEVSLTTARVNDAFVGYEDANGTAATTTKDYRMTNVRFHCQISYATESLEKAYSDSMKAGRIAIPYETYVALQHVPQSTNESVRLSSSLENVKALFCVHRFTADLNKIAKPSLGHFGNPLLEQIQLVAGGMTQPTVPLITATTNGTKATGQMIEELSQALERVDPDHHGDITLQKQAMEFTLATAANGDAVASNTGPKYDDVKKWNGSHIVGLALDSGMPFSSVYNRSNTQMGPGRKSDLMCTLKYTSDPQAYTTNFFMCHGNVLRITETGQMIPEQISF